MHKIAYIFNFFNIFSFYHLIDGLVIVMNG